MRDASDGDDIDIDVGLAQVVQRSQLGCGVEAPPSPRRSSRHVLLVAGVVIMSLVAAGVWFRADDEGSIDAAAQRSDGRPTAGQPSGLDGAVGAKPSAPATDVARDGRTPAVDYYDEVLASISGPILLPVSRPPDLSHVYLISANGQQALGVEHSRLAIYVGPSGSGGGWPLRQVDVPAAPGGSFSISYRDVNKNASSTPPPMDETLRAYWTTVQFQNERPAWLTADLYSTR